MAPTNDRRKPTRLSEQAKIHLLALLQRGGQATLPEVQDEIHRRTGRQLSMGAVYTTLERMRITGLVESELRDSTTSHGRRREMRYYWPTERGKAALQHALSRNDVYAMAEGVTFA